MKKLVSLVLGVATLAALPALAGNGAPSGPHYNLNIIGVENPKTSPMTGSDRHTIFVALGKKRPETPATSNIWLTPGDFQVCDGNGFDDAIDCQGNSKGVPGAVFQLPCNTNLSNTSDGAPVDIVACSSDTPSMSYEVWARALGKPNNSATVTTCAQETTDLDGNGTLDIVCSTENVLLVRNASKPVWKNVTDALTSLVAQIDGDAQLERVALFAGPFEDWFWQYKNSGLRLAQLRFYTTQ